MTDRDNDTDNNAEKTPRIEGSATGGRPRHGSVQKSGRPWSKWFASLEREERLVLVGKIEEGASAGREYVALMLMSTFLAALGLLEDSTAVVIGAMLVAPLMGPLMGAGLALVQGNARLMRSALLATGIGLCLGLLASIAVGLLNPGFEPSLEVEARGKPDLLDLAVAFVSGIVAAYAMSRPRVAGSLAGVAIAAALVPPLAVVGIGLTNDYPLIAGRAAILLMTNVVAIILGAALVFLVLGLRRTLKRRSPPAWVLMTTLVLLAAAGSLYAPLNEQIARKQRRGPDRPLTYPVAQRVRDAVTTYVEGHEGIEIIAIARSGVEPEAGITVLLSASSEVPARLDADLRRIITETRGRETILRIITLQEASSAATDD